MFWRKMRNTATKNEASYADILATTTNNYQSMRLEEVIHSTPSQSRTHAGEAIAKSYRGKVCSRQ
jgi:hypothetical protein